MVQAYIDRAKAYNGVCTALLTPDGADVAAGDGLRARRRAAGVPDEDREGFHDLPDLDQYRGLPLDYGRMERTVSDPSVMAQMGMRVGHPERRAAERARNAQHPRRAIGHVQGRVRCAPVDRTAPAGAPPGCEAFRRQPDALERAAELDAQYGAEPDLAALPMYCIVTAVKDPFDTKDMRTTANNDVNFAMDVPPFDATVVARLRAKGAIIYAKSVAHEFNGGPGDPGGAATAEDQPGARPTDDGRVGRPAVQPVRHRTRAARIERRLRRGGGGQPGDDRHLRAVGRPRARAPRRATASRRC